MGMQKSTYVFYGVLVAVHDPKSGEPYSYEVNQQLQEKFGYDTEIVADNVRWFMCGAYDRNDLYLAVDRDGHDSYEVDLGERRSFRVSTAHNPDWEVSLVQAADDLRLKILEGPCWFVVADES